jgi:beta-lactamase class D
MPIAMKRCFMSPHHAARDILLVLILLAINNSTAQTRFEQRPEFGKHFTKYGVNGSFLLYDMKQDKYIAYDSARCKQRFAPASTFKIFNSLVALETGVAPDEHFALKWDSVDHGRPTWNQDQDMAAAIKNSTVWFYQEIAHRIGEKRMKEWITREHYGNMDMSGGIDQFWLKGGMKISQEEQIDFLKRLYAGTLHFSRRSMDIVKRMILLKDTTIYTLRGKTGWHQRHDGNIGWLVGYLEQNGNVYFYATNVEAPEPAPGGFAGARRELTEAILRNLGLL